MENPPGTRRANPNTANAPVRRIILLARVPVKQGTPINRLFSPEFRSEGAWSGNTADVPPALTLRSKVASPRWSVGTNVAPLDCLADFIIASKPLILGG